MSFAKAEQLLELATMVAASHAGIMLSDVKERFECSHRTAQRMFGALERHFPDIESRFDEEGRKRWSFSVGHLPDLLTLEAEEVAALDLAIELFARAGALSDSHALKRLSDKVRSLVPRAKQARLETDHEALLGAQGVLTRPGPRPKIDEAVSAGVSEALKACRVLEIDYCSRNDDRPKTRRIPPYGVLTGARRYLVARPSSDPTGPLHTYRFDGVVSAEVVQERFTRQEDFDLHSSANRSFGVVQS